MLDGSAITYSLLLSTFALILARKRKKPTLPYPPGPKGYPILGNALDLPMSVPVWESFVSLANNHGMLFSVVLFPADPETVPLQARISCTYE